MLGTVLKRWNWLEDGLIPLAATLMTAAWAYPLFALFVRDLETGEPNPGFTFWLCLGILAAGVFAGRLARQNRMGAVIVVVGGLTAIAVSLLLAVPGGTTDLDLWIAEILDRVRSGRPGEVVPIPLLVGVCATLLWWRGLRIAGAEHAETTGAFVVGVTAIVGLLIVTAALPSQSSAGEAPRDLTSSLAPLGFMVSLPVAIGAALLARYLGEHAFTVSQLAIVIGLLFLSPVLPYAQPPSSLAGWILLFLGSGLATLSLQGVLQTLREQEQRIGVRLHVDRYWLLTMVSVVIVVLLLGILVGQIVAPGAFLRVLAVLRPVWTVLVRVVLFIVFIFAYLFFSLLEPLLARIEGRPRQTLPGPQQSPVRPEDLEDLAREPIQIPPIVGQIVQGLLILGAIALVAWFFFLAVRHQKRGDTLSQDDIPETRETILSADLIRTQIEGLLKGLRRGGPPPFLEPGPPGDPRRIVRELYQQILAKAIRLQVPRKRGETPNVYQYELSYLCPEERTSLETLTRVYVVARYGAVPPTHEQVEAAQEAFGRVDAALRAKLQSIES